MRRDELIVLRPDVIDAYPEGVPRWMRDLPAEDLPELMRLREEGYRLVGLEPGDDPEEMFL